MLDREHLGRVVDRAVAVVIVADGAVEHVIFEEPVERLALGGRGRGGVRRTFIPSVNRGSAGPDELSVHLDQARVAGLDRAELRVVAHCRQLNPDTQDDIDETLAGDRLPGRAVDRNRAHFRLTLSFMWESP